MKKLRNVVFESLILTVAVNGLALLGVRRSAGTHSDDLVHLLYIRDQSWWRHKWEHFPRYWPFVRGIHRSSVNSPHKGQWRGALMLSLICAWINAWVNYREADDLRRHRTHYDVIVMDWQVETTARILKKSNPLFQTAMIFGSDMMIFGYAILCLCVRHRVCRYKYMYIYIYIVLA